MKALRFDNHGLFAEVLHLVEVPKPVLREDEVLVQISASCVNPSDTKNVLGRMEGTILPRTPGRDFSGVVVEGPSPLLGLEVWATGGDIGFVRDGAHAEYIALPVEGVAPKPPALTMSEAACVGTSYLTAYLGLVEAANVQAGEWVLVTGARGGVGSSVIQLALWKGARVIAVDRGARGREPLRQFGIEVVLNSDTDDIVRSVKELVGREGVNVAFDCVGGPLFETCLKTLGQLGRQVNITSLGERRVSFDLVDFYHRRLAIYGVDSRPYDTVACARILRELTPAFESGKLKPPHISGVHTLEQFASAYQLVDSGQARGKVVFMV